MKGSLYLSSHKTKIIYKLSSPSIRQKPNATQSEISETQDFIKSLIKKIGVAYFFLSTLFATAVNIL